MNAVDAHRLPITSLPSQTWYRAVDPAFASAAPRPSVGITRFNDGPSGSPGYRLLYFVPDPVTALYEVEALLGSIFSFAVPNPFRGAVIARHTVPPLDVVDLGDPANRSLVDTTRQELTSDWRAYRQPKPLPLLRKPSRALSTRPVPLRTASSPPQHGIHTSTIFIVFYDRVLRPRLAAAIGSGLTA